MNEAWKAVSGYEGIYEISNLGRVKSLKRKCPYQDGFRTKPERILKTNIINGGYAQVTLEKSGTRKSLLVHRLVAMAFIPNPEAFPQVNHINGNKTDNRAENLEWCTAKENMVHSVVNCLRSDLKPVVMLSKDGCIVRKFNGLKEAARSTGIARQNIRFCCNHERRTAGGYFWRWCG